MEEGPMVSMKLSRCATPLFALGLLAGCGGAVDEGDYYGFTMSAFYQPPNLGYVQAQGPVPLVVLNSPFVGASREIVGAEAASAMSGANAGPPLTFSFAPGGVPVVPLGAPSSYYVVLVFGQANVGSLDLCQLRQPQIVPVPGRIHAEATFCIGAQRITEIEGTMRSAATGPTDPKFRDFLKGLTVNLLPPPDEGMRPPGFGFGRIR
jgi:hypothetical protein